MFILRVLMALGYALLSVTTFIFDLTSKTKGSKNSKYHLPAVNYIPKYASASYKKAKPSRFYGFKMFTFGAIFFFIFVSAPIAMFIWFSQLPNPDLLLTKSIPQPTKILDRKGRLLYEVYIDRKFEPVGLGKIPKHVIDSTIAVEDDSFYSHGGFDFKSTMRALKATLFEDTVQGGSTITQQLIKNVLLTSERTIERKVKELALALLVETRYSKDQILELYLNNVSYGGTAWGIESAAQKFYGKNVQDLNLAESALLAGVISAPSTYSPITHDIQIAKSRQKYVLDRMVILGSISREDADAAYAQELGIKIQNDYIRAPHYVAYVRAELEKIYGRRFLETAGLTVTTTLDVDLQEKVQDIVEQEVAKDKIFNISNGAALVLDSRQAEVLAYVGSIDYFKEDWGAYDVVSAYRQPGSSIKPLTYALALEQGYTTASIIDDSPVSFNVKGQKPYTPKNYDGKYRGKVTLRQALANSLNIPAVKLVEKLGPDNLVRFGTMFGLSNWEVDGSYGLSITLGGKEVRFMDLVNMYATFAREGVYKSPEVLLSVRDANGYELHRDSSVGSQAVSKEVAYLIWHILSDARARVPAFGTRNSLTVQDKTVAVKTGTTDEIRDNYTIGFTPSYTVGVWVGNNDNAPLNKNLASGITGAAPMWNKIMSGLLAEKSDEPMQRPDKVAQVVDKDCGASEVFIKGSNAKIDLCPDRAHAELAKEEKNN